MPLLGTSFTSLFARKHHSPSPKSSSHSSFASSSPAAASKASPKRRPAKLKKRRPYSAAFTLVGECESASSSSSSSSSSKSTRSTSSSSASSLDSFELVQPKKDDLLLDQPLSLLVDAPASPPPPSPLSPAERLREQIAQIVAFNARYYARPPPDPPVYEKPLPAFMTNTTLYTIAESTDEGRSRSNLSLALSLECRSSCVDSDDTDNDSILSDDGIAWSSDPLFHYTHFPAPPLPQQALPPPTPRLRSRTVAFGEHGTGAQVSSRSAWEELVSFGEPLSSSVTIGEGGELSLELFPIAEDREREEVDESASEHDDADDEYDERFVDLPSLRLSRSLNPFATATTLCAPLVKPIISKPSWDAPEVSHDYRRAAILISALKQDLPGTEAAIVNGRKMVFALVYDA
ncbi:hypothetical protein MNV49_007126 [Pseudohyphozyma bogoriensis]|nr:hypothetical protein MNV49_007126 [Pseudohyphozyma bogoriensis]